MGPHFSFGQDSDAPQAQIRAIRFAKASIPIAFAAMQCWYARNPVGTVSLVNTEKASLTDVEVALYALFSEAVFRTEGTTIAR